MRLLNTNYRRTRVLGERVKVPEFSIVDSPTIRIANLKRHRFSVIDHSATVREIAMAEGKIPEYVGRRHTISHLNIIHRPPDRI